MRGFDSSSALPGGRSDAGHSFGQIEPPKGLEASIDSPLHAAVTVQKARGKPASAGRGEGIPDPLQTNLLNRTPAPLPTTADTPVQRLIGFEFELGALPTRELLPQQEESKREKEDIGPEARSHSKGEVLVGRAGYNVTADINANSGDSQIEFVTEEMDENGNGAQATLRGLGVRILKDILAILRAADDAGAQGEFEWVGLDKVEGFNGRPKDQVWPAARWKNMYGQLQMTGGVSLDKLDRLLSGSALGARPANPDIVAVNRKDPEEVKEATKQDLLNNFYAQTNVNPETGLRTDKQLAYRTALAQVQALGAFDRFWWGKAKAERHFASVVTLMAMTPISLRLGPLRINELTGLLLAKTDFAKIVQLAAIASGGTLNQAQLRTALVNTINAHVDPEHRVNIASSVYPDDFNDKGTTFTDLNIATWVQGVIPAPSSWGYLWKSWGYEPGVDRSTSANFEGTEEQRAGLRAFGTFGEKTDPGDKIILEFRNFGYLHAERLPYALPVLGEYMKTGVHQK